MRLLKFTLLLSILTSFSFSQTTYIWTGSVNSGFSTAGNWTPSRQVGLNTDILVFETGSSLNVSNVYQVTIGQLIVRNNTNLTLSPASGNAKCITIKGSTGEDLIIESGSSLKISSNDPALNIYLSASATASISGNLTFQGEIAHYINSADPLSIKFNSGSVLMQNCPGNIFNTSGTHNSVIFRNGSTFKINHTDALSPFGVSAPNTKVIFENESNLMIIGNSSIKLDKRTIPNLTIEQNAVFNAKESFSDGITIGNLTVKNSGSLIIENTNANNFAGINIQGNINITGSLKFSTNTGNRLNVKLNGTDTQSISGSGEIVIPENLNMFAIENDIVLFRDLNIDCPVSHDSGSVVLNGHFIKLPNSKNPGGTFTRPGNEPVEFGTDSKHGLPLNFSISQNYPNPFNPSTKIDFSIPAASKVTIKVYDISGKETATLLNSNVESGYHTVDFNASNLSSGIYFYTILAGEYTRTMKMILTK
ncbi:MAG: T9SS type A sorting domain-containing protein [Ignavibacteria bacterium]|nr:T9SS type A sorting domain-containing protein [Ignavibacteria bacterium]MCC7158102.1 T9SS type A sorting domain-containing protein [Ignavibacteria bacterium]